MLMPTIRIDDEVFNGLKKLAEPFTDSPGSVIRRLLVEKGILKDAPARMRRPAQEEQVQIKALTPALTPQDAYEQFLLVTLNEEFAGHGEKRAVTRAVIEKMVRHGFIGPADLELVATGETKAENTITWGRNALKNRGLIRRGSKRGVWELSDDGREAARNITLPKPARR
jgi:predicted CopG family antitoxin